MFFIEKHFDVIALKRYPDQGGDTMAGQTKRSTIYFDPDLHEALRLKAAHSHQSISDIVNEAVRNTLSEDQEDLVAFEQRACEAIISYEDLLNDLKSHGKI